MASFLASAGYFAVAGALGLSIAGLVSSFTRRRFRGRSHYRFRRSVNGSSSRALERTMELIRREDVTRCGMRLLCELARLRQDHLTGEEQAILNLVGPVIDPWSGVSPRGALQEYKTAKGFGEAGGDCGKAFSLCPLNGTQLMETVLGYVPWDATWVWRSKLRRPKGMKCLVPLSKDSRNWLSSFQQILDDCRTYESSILHQRAFLLPFHLTTVRYASLPTFTYVYLRD